MFTHHIIHNTCVTASAIPIVGLTIRVALLYRAFCLYKLCECLFILFFLYPAGRTCMVLVVFQSRHPSPQYLKLERASQCIFIQRASVFKTEVIGTVIMAPTPTHSGTDEPERAQRCAILAHSHPTHTE